MLSPHTQVFPQCILACTSTVAHRFAFHSAQNKARIISIKLDLIVRRCMHKITSMMTVASIARTTGLHLRIPTCRQPLSPAIKGNRTFMTSELQRQARRLTVPSETHKVHKVYMITECQGHRRRLALAKDLFLCVTVAVSLHPAISCVVTPAMKIQSYGKQSLS